MGFVSKVLLFIAMCHTTEEAFVQCPSEGIVHGQNIHCNVQSGADVCLVCPVNLGDKDSVKWLRNGKLIYSEGFLLTQDNYITNDECHNELTSLLINNISHMDDFYQCRERTLDRRGYMLMRTIIPSLKLSKDSRRSKDGHLTLLCTATQVSGSVTFTWLLNGNVDKSEVYKLNDTIDRNVSSKYDYREGEEGDEVRCTVNGSHIKSTTAFFTIKLSHLSMPTMTPKQKSSKNIILLVAVTGVIVTLLVATGIIKRKCMTQFTLLQQRYVRNNEVQSNYAEVGNHSVTTTTEATTEARETTAIARLATLAINITSPIRASFGRLGLIVAGALVISCSSVFGVVCFTARKCRSSRARKREGTQDIAYCHSLNILDPKVSDTDLSSKETVLQKDERKELPKIPDDGEDSQHSEGSEPNYYSTVDTLAGKDSRMVSEKDISIIMTIKMGKIYKRWMGSVNLANETNKCVVLTTLTDRVMKMKEIHWETFLRKSLNLPEYSHLAKIEAISIQSSELYLISEHLVCEDLHTVLLRDTKEQGDYYCCSSLPVPDVIKHIAGVLEGMDVLKTFGFLHPGLTTKKVLLTKGGIVKLFDFCLAVDASKMATLKKAEMSSVTLNEFPPEMLLLSEYTESSDVWSTAVVIWEIMAAGNPPFPQTKEVNFDEVTLTPSAPWPEKYLQIKDKILFECWNHNATLRPSIHHLRGTFLKIFETLIADSSYEIPMATTYLPMTSADATQTTYAERIYHDEK